MLLHADNIMDIIDTHVAIYNYALAMHDYMHNSTCLPVLEKMVLNK